MKKQSLKVLLILLVITLIGTALAPICSYAATKSVSIKKQNSKTTITNAITNIINKNSSTSKTTNTTTTEKNKTDSSTKGTVIIVPSNRSKTLTTTYEAIKDKIVSKKEESKVEETEPIEGIETIESSLETYIHKSAGILENVEVGSNLVYTIYLKNNSATTKTLQLKSSMKEATLGGKIMANVYKVEPVVEGGTTYKGKIDEQQIQYRELMSITLRPNEEKAIRLEQKVENYVSNNVRNVFTIVYNNEEIHLEDTKQMTAPAKINAEMKLYLNDVEMATKGKLQLKENDKVQYAITLSNSGETKAEINIKDTLPKGFEIAKIEYLDQNNTVISTVEHAGNQLNIEKMEIKPNQTIKLLLTVKVRITVNRQIENFAEISGDTIKSLNTNTTTNIFVGKNVSDKEIVDTKSFEKETTVPTKGTSTNDILAYFGDTSFKAYKFSGDPEIDDSNVSQYPSTYDMNNIGDQLVMYSQDMFTSKRMFCVKINFPYWRWFRLENFYTMYEGDIYRYNKPSKQLVKDDIPTSGVGIGNEYYGNLINEHYNELSYILSEIERLDEPTFYQNIGLWPQIVQFNGDRPRYNLSPTQVAIWKLEKVPENEIKNKIKNGLIIVMQNIYGDEAGKAYVVDQNGKLTSWAEQVINGILSYANSLYASSLAYDKHVDGNYIGSIPKITCSFKNIIEVNGRELVGPFKVVFPITTGSTTYTDITGIVRTINEEYGQISQLSVKNGTTTYSNLYNEKGERIYEYEGNGTLEFYIDVKGTNFDGTKETIVTAKMNNQYRNSYCYTLDNYCADTQPFIIGNGKMSVRAYDETFKLEVEKMTLSGKVWLDVQQGEKDKTRGNVAELPNGEIDENEEGIAGIQVILVSKTENKKISTTETNQNGEYEFKDIPKAEYFLLFEYEGINYIATKTGGDSKAAENITINGKNIRTNFNERFNSIEKDKRITKAYDISAQGQLIEYNNNIIMEYSTTTTPDGTMESQLFTTLGSIVPNYKMYSKTEKTYKQTTANINFGLQERKASLSLTTALESIDTEKRKEEKISVVYSVNLNNHEEKAKVNELIYYYEPQLEYDSATLTEYSGTTLTNFKVTEEAEETIINGIKYKKLKITIKENMMEPNGRDILKLTFKTDSKNTRLTEQYIAYAEITSYSIEGGLVDYNSEPGNGITKDGRIIDEDDFDEANIEELRNKILKDAMQSIAESLNPVRTPVNVKP